LKKRTKWELAFLHIKTVLAILVGVDVAAQIVAEVVLNQSATIQFIIIIVVALLVKILVE
jgi:hypothetical protein